MKRLSIKYFDHLFFIKFIGLFVAFYLFNEFFIGLTAPGGTVYSPVMQNNFDYVTCLSNTILEITNFICNTVGINTYFFDSKTLKIYNGPAVTMGFSCIGLQILSCWIAFVIASYASIKNKFLWSVGGALAIVLLNSGRIAVLLAALKNKWPIHFGIDHHDIFNWISYSFILLLIYFFQRNRKAVASE